MTGTQGIKAELVIIVISTTIDGSNNLLDLVPVAQSLVFNSMLDGVVVIDSNNRIVDMNQAVQSLFNIDLEVFLGQSVQRLFTAVGLPDNRLTEGSPVSVVKNRNNRWFHLQTSTITDYKVRSKGRIVIFRDVTSEREAEAKLEQANRQLTLRIEELDRKNREIEQLNILSSQLQSCTSIKDEVLPLMAKYMEDLFPEIKGRFFEFDEEQNRFHQVVQWGENDTAISNVYDEALCKSCKQGGLRPLNELHTVMSCPQYIISHPDESLCVPLQDQESLFGHLHLYGPKGVFNQSNLQLVRTVSDHVTLTLSNLKMRQILHYQSLHDPLTGLFNRRYMEEALVRELDKAIRAVNALAVMMLDIDYFKNLNDEYGHTAGDQILQHLAVILHDLIRKSDIACRYGGEEFIIIMPMVSLETAVQRAEVLRHTIESMPFVIQEDRRVNITVSIGVACYPQNAVDVESLLLAADQALYRAKAQGRNRVCFSSM